MAICSNINLNNGLPLINTSTMFKVADILVKSSQLVGTIVDGSVIPTLIDEIPIIAVATAFTEGTTLIKDTTELKASYN